MIIGIFLQFHPFLIENELNEIIVPDLLLKLCLPFPALGFGRIFEIILPEVPGGSFMIVLSGHEKGIVGKPFILPAEGLILSHHFTVLGKIILYVRIQKSVISLAQKSRLERDGIAVVDIFRIPYRHILKIGIIQKS